MRTAPFSMALLALVAACTGGTDEPECVPAASNYDDTIHPILEAKCGTCHGEEPQFGAPYSLVDGYDDLIAGSDGSRKVDRALDAVLSGRMPQESGEPLTHNELDTLVGWLSCGTEHADDPTGLVANRDVWEAPPSAPAGATPIELTAVNESVGLDAIDDYREFSFANIVQADQFIRRIEPIIDESRVLHHITLTRPQGFPFLYAWAPGTQAIEFPDGGIRLTPNQELKIQIHYNNGAGVEDAVDSSGVRLWVSDPTGTEYGMASPSTWNISVPPNSTQSVTQTCTATMDFTVVAGFPHMHEIGSTFNHDVIRSDGTVDNLINLTGWSFESQYFYEMDVDVRAGDRLEMTCGYDNPHDYTVRAGEGTTDEMCFDFLVVTPASAMTQCAF